LVRRRGFLKFLKKELKRERVKEGKERELEKVVSKSGVFLFFEKLKKKMKKKQFFSILQ